MGALLACSWASPSPALAAGKSVEVASQEEMSRAQAQFEVGRGHFEASRWDEAVAAFRASHDVVASPTTHLMLGRALRKGGRLLEAWTELWLAADEARELSSRIPRYAEAAELAEAEVAGLRLEIALVSVKVEGAPQGADLRVAGAAIDETGWRSIPVVPGKTRIEVAAGDGRTAATTIDAVAGAEHEVLLALAASSGAPAPAAGASPIPVAADAEPPPRPARRGIGVPVIAAAGVGLAGFVTFGVFGAMTRSTNSSLEEKCPDQRCPESVRDDVDTGRTQQTIANVGLAVGLVGAGAAVTLFLLDRPAEGRSGRRAVRRARLHATPSAVSLQVEL